MNSNNYNRNNRQNLNFDEEVSLSKKIQAGNEAEKILGKGGLLTDEERKTLELRAEEGRLACEELTEANYCRAMKFANEAWRKNPFGVNELEDYEQTALKVVFCCAKTFDWKKGYRFGTYVHNCLRNEMVRENSKTAYALRIPEESLVQLSAIKREMEESADKKGSSVSGMKDSEYKKLEAACRQSLSLQSSLADDGADVELGDILSDTQAMTAEQIEEKIDMENLIDCVREGLEYLPEDEKYVLKGRMGFFGEVMPLKSFVGIVANSISGVQKKQISGIKHLSEKLSNLPLAG